MRRRIVAPVHDGRVDPQGVVLYAEIDDPQPQGKLWSWVPISLAGIPSEQQLEEEAVAVMKERIEVFRQSLAVVGTQK